MESGRERDGTRLTGEAPGGASRTARAHARPGPAGTGLAGVSEIGDVSQGRQTIRIAEVDGRTDRHKLAQTPANLHCAFA